MFQSFWRYRWQAFALSLLICLVGWWGIFRFANPQAASANVHLELAGAEGANKAIGKVAAVREYLLDRKASSALNAKLSSKFGAPPGGADWLDYLQARLKITSLGEGHEFSASLSVAGPASAADVLNALLLSVDQRIQSEDKASQATQAAATSAALTKAQRRLAMLEQRINKAREIAAAENANSAVAKPSDVDPDAELSRAIQRRDEIRLKLNQLETKANASSGNSAGGNAKQAADPLAERLKTLQTQLQSLLARYTEQHPDVVATRRQIEIMQKQSAAGKSLPRPGEATAKRMEALKTTPGYADAMAELARAEADVAAWQARVNTVRQAATATNASGDALAAEHQAAKSHYEQLLAQQKALTDAGGRGQRFRVIQAARPATGWNTYRELVLSGCVWLLACLLGFALPQLLASLRPVIVNPQSLQGLSGWPILGTISAVLTSDEEQGLHADKVSYAVACSMLVLGLLLITGVQYLRPSWLPALVGQAG